MRSVLLSVRPRFARGLLEGTKTAEVRRRFPSVPAGTELFVYSSTPIRAVLGTLILEGIDLVQASDVWAGFSDRIEIGSSELDTYLAGKREASILGVTSPDLWPNPVPLSRMRERIGLQPPQSWRYLDPEKAEVLRELGQATVTPATQSLLVSTV